MKIKTDAEASMFWFFGMHDVGCRIYTFAYRWRTADCCPQFWPKSIVAPPETLLWTDVADMYWRPEGRRLLLANLQSHEGTDDACELGRECLMSISSLTAPEFVRWQGGEKLLVRSD